MPSKYHISSCVGLDLKSDTAILRVVSNKFKTLDQLQERLANPNIKAKFTGEMRHSLLYVTKTFVNHKTISKAIETRLETVSTGFQQCQYDEKLSIASMLKNNIPVNRLMFLGCKTRRANQIFQMFDETKPYQTDKKHLSVFDPLSFSEVLVPEFENSLDSAALIP